MAILDTSNHIHLPICANKMFKMAFKSFFFLSLAPEGGSRLASTFKKREVGWCDRQRDEGLLGSARLSRWRSPPTPPPPQPHPRGKPPRVGGWWAHPAAPFRTGPKKNKRRSHTAVSNFAGRVLRPKAAFLSRDSTACGFPIHFWPRCPN